MSSKRNVVLSGAIAGIIAIALIAAAIFVPGAGILKSSNTTSGSSSQSGTLGIQLTDPPTVPPGVTDVYISYSEMEVHVADAGNYSGWYKVAPAGEIDLMSILNTSITLGTSQVTSGIFNAVGFNITSATVTVNGVNQSAFISNNKMIVPLVGGLLVQSSSSEGILVDLSPTVLAVMNGSQTAYVLIPNAHALHIPDSSWKDSDRKGDVVKDIQQQKWFEDEGRGNISLSKAVLTNDSLSVAVTNNGANSTVVSSLTVAYSLEVLCQQYSGACMTPEHGDLPKAIPVAEFAVLSNGTLYQYNFTSSAVCHYTESSNEEASITSTNNEHSLSSSTTSEQTVSSTSSFVEMSSSSTSSMTQTGECQVGPNADQFEAEGLHFGYVLAPGQSVTFTFNGKIATITPDILNYIHISVAIPTTLMNALSNINAGQQYIIAASGPFDTFATEQVTAS